MDTPDGIAAAIGVLNADLERQVGRVAELKALVAQLTVYANGTVEPTATAAKKKRRPGRPSLDDSDAARRAAKRDAMRRRRARIKAEKAAEAAAKVKPKPQKRAPRKKVATPIADKAEATADSPPAANGHALPPAADTSIDSVRAKLVEAKTLAEIIPLVAAAAASVNATETAQDVDGFRLALQLRLHCEHRAGEILSQQGKRVPIGKLGISNQASRWREISRTRLGLV